MRKSRFTESQIIKILDSQKEGVKVEDICRSEGISPATFYGWKQKYGGMDTEELQKMKKLEAENQRLKKLLADKSLDYDILQEGYNRLKKK